MQHCPYCGQVRYPESSRQLFLGIGSGPFLGDSQDGVIMDGRSRLGGHWRDEDY